VAGFRFVQIRSQTELRFLCILRRIQRFFLVLNVLSTDIVDPFIARLLVLDRNDIRVDS